MKECNLSYPVATFRDEILSTAGVHVSNLYMYASFYV